MSKYSPEKGEIIVAPLKTKEIAEILARQYLEAAGENSRPSREQKNWSDIIAVSASDREFGNQLKEEREELRENISYLIGKMIDKGQIGDVTETKRGEIIAATIENLAARK